MAIRVLLVDDDAALLQTLQGIFRIRKFDVWTASSTQTAIEKLAECRFDLVVTDMRMETPLAGYNVVRAAKAQVQGPVTVILSAFPIPAAEWKQAGADLLVLKGAKGAFRMLNDIIEMVQHRSGNSPSDPSDTKKAS